MRTSFGGRVMAALVGIVLLGQGITSYVVTDAARRSAVVNTEHDLRVAAGVFDRFLASRGTRLATAVRLVTGDATAIGPETFDTLTGQGKRMGASLTLLLGADGAPRAASGLAPVPTTAALAPLAPLLAAATAETPADGVLVIESHAYHVVVVRLPAGLDGGWVVMGFEFGAALANEFKAIALVDLTLLGGEGTGGSVAVGTLPAAGTSAVAGQITALEPGVAAQLGNGRYFSLVHDPGNGLVAVLHRAEDQAFESVSELSRHLRNLTLGVLGVCLLVGIGLARGVTLPFQRLVDRARQLGADYHDQTVRLDRRDEIGELTTTLDGMRRSISEREARLTHQASHDALTGLPNRALATARLRHALDMAAPGEGEAGTPVATLLVNIDRFREINDTLGHAVGDTVLQHVAQRLAGAAGPTDTVARLGADEFLVVAAGCTPARAEALAWQLIAAVGRPLQLHGLQLNLTATASVAAHPEHGRSAEELLRRADIAMQAAKAGQLVVGVYQDGQDEGHLRRLTLAADLRQAISLGQLSCVYQPKGDLRSENISGAEALVRWNHPMLGAISPAEFIPLAEQNGQVRQFTQWMLLQVVRQLREWMDGGLRIGVAVNVSALDLMDAGLPQLVTSLLEEHGVPPVLLSLEITESAVMRDTAYAVRVLEALREAGIGLAIDDFGTGYSSLSQLQRLPVDELKIDRSFVIALDQPGADTTLVRSTIDLGHNMGLKVIAEGVETPRCLAVLQGLGCDQVQGYVLAPPLAATELVTWLQARGTKVCAPSRPRLVASLAGETCRTRILATRP